MKNGTVVQLGEVCKFLNGGTPSRAIKKYFQGDIPWITSTDITEDIVTKARSYITEEAIKNSATSIVPAGNILLVTRTSVGKIAIAGTDICISQDFTGIVPDKQKVNTRYLFYFLKEKESYFLSQKRGATIKGVTRDIVSRIEIPLPPLSEQKRIAMILDKADAIRRKRANALELADEFLKSVFLDMFGDPVRNPKGWPTDLFGNVGELDRGRSRHRPRNAPELLGGSYPLIQTGDISNSGGYIRSYTQTYSELGLAQSKMWPVGTLCITIAANIAKTAILTIDACFPDSVVGFKPNGKVRTEYVQYWLSFLQKILEDNAPESAQKNINLEILRGLKIPVPPVRLQDKFVKSYHSVAIHL